MNKYSVAIIGCGSIGALKGDKYDSPSKKNILTHAHACHNHPQIDKTVFYDINSEKAKDASKKWTGSYHNINIIFENLIKEYTPEIIIIASPTETHLEMVRKAIEHKPKIIILEKPAGSTLQECQDIWQLSVNYQIPILVDYIRRFAPGYRKIQQEIDDNELGAVYNCRVIYTGGLKHEGCHALDLMRYFFGNFRYGEILSPPLIDYSPYDISYTVHMGFEACSHVMLTPVDGRDYSIFEIDILGKHGRVRFIEKGLKAECSYPTTENIYMNHKTLSYGQTVFETGLNTALYNLLQNAVDYIEDQNTKLLCTIKDALEVHKIYSQLL